MRNNHATSGNIIKNQKDEEGDDVCDNRNLVHVHEICREKDSSLYFVMELMERNLQNFIESKSNSGIQESEIRSILQQAFKGLACLHGLGFVHRDIKPENLMMRDKIVKLGDFSLVRAVHPAKTKYRYLDSDHRSTTMTGYVGTRWYRAPELLLDYPWNNDSDNIDTATNGYRSYDKGVDIFAMGLVAAELYRCCPLFRGSDDAEQLELIKNLLLVDCCGNDIDSDKFIQRKESVIVLGRLAHEIPTIDRDSLQFIQNLLHYHKERRLSATEALRQTYFLKYSQRPSNYYQSQDQQKLRPSLEQQELFQSNKYHDRAEIVSTPRRSTALSFRRCKHDNHTGTGRGDILPTKTTDFATRKPVVSSINITPNTAIMSPTTHSKRQQFLASSSSKVDAAVKDYNDILQHTDRIDRKRLKISASLLFNID